MGASPEGRQVRGEQLELCHWRLSHLYLHLAGVLCLFLHHLRGVQGSYILTGLGSIQKLTQSIQELMLVWARRPLSSKEHHQLF